MQKLQLFNSVIKLPRRDRAVLFQWLEAQRHTQMLAGTLSGHLHLLSTPLHDALPPASVPEQQVDHEDLVIEDENTMYDVLDAAVVSCLDQGHIDHANDSGAALQTGGDGGSLSLNWEAGGYSAVQYPAVVQGVDKLEAQMLNTNGIDLVHDNMVVSATRKVNIVDGVEEEEVDADVSDTATDVERVHLPPIRKPLVHDETAGSRDG